MTAYLAVWYLGNIYYNIYNKKACIALGKNAAGASNAHWALSAVQVKNIRISNIAHIRTTLFQFESQYNFSFHRLDVNSTWDILVEWTVWTIILFILSHTLIARTLSANQFRTSIEFARASYLMSTNNKNSLCATTLKCTNRNLHSYNSCFDLTAFGGWSLRRPSMVSLISTLKILV